MVSRHCLECHFDCLISVEGKFAHQMVEPPSIENSFHFAEYSLYRIEFRTVAHVPNWQDVERGEVRPRVHWLVYLQLVHKEGERTLPVLPSQLLQEFNELFGCESLWVDRVRTYALLFGHRSYHCLVPRIYALLIDSEVGVSSWPISLHNRSLGKYDLVYKDDLSILESCLLEWVTSMHAVGLESPLRVLRHVFLLPHLLALDAMF